jgi:predicted  nucleic acid-binding Zn-ribbon protein
MEVKTNKEYQAMQKEMSVAEQEISDQETRMLERMEEADGLAIELKAAEAALKTEQTAIAQDRQALETERTQIEQELQRTSDDRARTAGQVSKDALAVFDRIALSRKGLAMAEARDGLCTVCHVRLRPQVFNEARRNATLIHCDSCNRLLYFVPVPSAAVQTTPDAP